MRYETEEHGDPPDTMKPYKVQGIIDNDCTRLYVDVTTEMKRMQCMKATGVNSEGDSFVAVELSTEGSVVAVHFYPEDDDEQSLMNNCFTQIVECRYGPKLIVVKRDFLTNEEQHERVMYENIQNEVFDND